MIAILTPGSHFFPEQSWIARVFATFFCGAHASNVVIAPGNDNMWHIRPEGDTARELVLPNVFFPEQDHSVWLTPNHARGSLAKVGVTSNSGEEQSLSVPFALPNATTLDDVDIFGSAFFLLSRYEECASPKRDSLGRVDESDLWQIRHNCHRVPLVDILFDLLARKITEQLLPGWHIPAREYRCCVSHDIDMPLLWLVPSRLRALLRIARRFVETHSLSFLLRALSASHNTTRDPFNSFAWFLDAEARLGIRSACYFLAGGTHPNDAAYSLSLPFIQDILALLQERGAETGLHGSFDAAWTPGLLAAEAKNLRHNTKATISGGRQHWLTFDARQTWRFWQDAGMDYDSSLGFSHDVGFRCGTCREYPAYDWQERRPLDLLERPLLVMENSLLEKHHLGLSHAAAFDLVKDLHATVRQYGGCFTLLWHNSSLYSEELKDLYRACLTICA